MIDPAWVGGVLIVIELGLWTQFGICLRAPSRYSKRHDELQKSVEEGYSNTVTARLAKVIRTAVELRGGGGTSEAGDVPLQPFEDVLASGELYEECEALKDSLRSAESARSIVRRSIWIQRTEAGAIAAALLILPVTFWPAIFDRFLIDGSLLHILNTLLGVSLAIAGASFVATIAQENQLAAALVKHRPHNERIG